VRKIDALGLSAESGADNHFQRRRTKMLPIEMATFFLGMETGMAFPRHRKALFKVMKPFVTN